MCGIAGIVSENRSLIQPALLKAMTSTLAHRGPDGEGYWINENTEVALGHRRLAIIDLSNASAQPITYLGRYTITFNGEIFNYREIRNELKKQGYSFSSRGDAEVILAAYDCYKEKCLSLFDGMFAFVIWDELDKTLFAARDRFGEKPFYYSATSNTIFFASEMKALWKAAVEKTVDEKMMLNYITLGYVQNPADKSQTFFRNIYSLPPSHFMQVSLYPFKIHIEQYWDIDKQFTQKITESQASEKLLQMLTDSIRFRLRSDVEVGTSLSGGIDSSTIASIVKNEMPTESKNFKTFSAVFPGFAKDESKYINELTSQLHLPNFSVQPSHEEFIKNIEKLAWHQEEPFPSSSVYAQYKVFELAKEHGVKVLLDGQGADEIFAGYHKYIHWYLQEILSRHRFKKFTHEKHAFNKHHVPVKWDVRNVVAAFLPSHVAIALEKAEYRRIIHHPNINRSLIAHSKGREWEGVHKPIITKLNDILYFNTMRNGLEELLRFADRNSMAHGLEVRLPFLQHHLVSFAFSLPSTLKINNGFPKWILRKAMEDRLPASIIWRTDKTAYEPPQKMWMESAPMQDCIHEAKKTLVEAQILKPASINKKIRPMDAHMADNFDWRYLSAAFLYT
ncbi:MAG: asparagine synthase (glutamine-hydrolyzing) [Chitinophagaceae bacterium]|nr:MAG: asparagine synthase (glutamine-hydrolyzing) [Chitinophagaceae bacterium]